MEFRILGPLEVIEDGQALELGGQKQRAVLAVLLLEANRVVSSDRLIEALWEEGPPETAQKALQVYVSQLRKTLGRERIGTRAPGYLVRVGEGELDLERFQELRAEGRLAEALSLWRGSPLSDFAYQRFGQTEIARLEELRLACLEDRLEADLASGRHVELVGELEALAREHPLRQRLRGQLMLALYRSGRDAEALDAYRETRRMLVEELGIEPRRELQGLQQRILRQDPSLDLVAEEVHCDSMRGAFVGREPELKELCAGLDDAVAGRGRLVLLVGEPGIGKSRLADELVSRARARGARVLVGRCWEAGGAPAFWPWVQSLRACIRETDAETLRAQLGAGASELAQLLPELRELFPDLPEPPELEPESARFRLFEAAAGFLGRVAQARPVVLFLDDLHAADESSLLLLQFVARELGSTRILALGVCRDVDPTPSDSLTAALTELAREPVTAIVRLGGLSAQDVARLIELSAGAASSAEVVAAIHGETEGNPLFVGEIVRLLASEGRLGAETAQLAIPQSVRDVIARRLRHLSKDCNELLALASVLGREFALDTLASLAGLAVDALLDTLDEAMAARVVSDAHDNPTALRFAHVLIRDTLYERLTTARRVRLHRLVVETLEAAGAPEAHLAELAHHAIAGSDFERGVLYAQRAGDRALSILAHEDAARLYEIALESLELTRAGDEARRCQLLLGLGEAQRRVGNTLASRAAFLDAAEIARRLALPRELGRAAAGYGGGHAWARAGTDPLLVPLLEEGLAGLEDADVELRARLLARLAGALRDEHSQERRDRISREAVELARRSGNLPALAYALDGRVTAVFNPATVAESLALATELCELAERLGDRERMASGELDKLIAHAMVGDVDEARSGTEQISAIAVQLRQPELLFLAKASQSMLALACGDFAAAEELIPAFFAFGERAQPEMVRPILTMQRYTLCEFRDELEQVKPELTELVADYPARPAFRCALAHLELQLGRRDEAQAAFDALAADEFAGLPFDQEWLFGISLLAEICAAVDDKQNAATLYRLLAPWGSLVAVDHPEGFRGAISRYLALLAMQLEGWDDAARHFENAIAMNERMGARPWLAHTQCDYGRMLVERGETKRASELVAAALATYRELGMDGAAARGLELAQRFSAAA